MGLTQSKPPADVSKTSIGSIISAIMGLTSGSMTSATRQGVTQFVFNAMDGWYRDENYKYAVRTWSYMNKIPITTLFFFVWFIAWRGFASSDMFLDHARGYLVSGELGLLVSILVLLYLAQAMFISFYLKELAKPIFYKIYSFLFVPVSTVFYTIVILKVVSFSGYNISVEYYYFIFEGFLILMFYSSMQMFFGEEILPRLNPAGQRFWTSRLPPSHVSEMYRGFFLLFAMFFLPFIMSFRYMAFT